MAAVVTYAQLPDEEPAFLNYLQKTGDVWARAVGDRLPNIRFAPLPAAEFLEHFADEIRDFNMISIYIGMRPDIVDPVITKRPDIYDGEPFVNFMASNFIRYDRGEFRSENELAQSNLCYYSGDYQGEEYVTKPELFLKWARNILSWVRRRTPESVPVERCNYETRATKKVAAACRTGLKVGY